MPSSILPQSVLHSSHAISKIEGSNLAGREKSAIRAYWDGLHDRLGAMTPSHVSQGALAAKEGVSLLRQDIVAGLTGFGVAYLEHLAGGLDWKGIPIDGIVAGLAGVGSVAAPFMGIEGLSPEFRTVSSTALGILTYRKGKEKWSGTSSPFRVKGESLQDFAKDL